MVVVGSGSGSGPVRETTKVSANPDSPDLNPTPTHHDPDTQEDPSSRSPVAPEDGFGRVDQVSPSQTCTSISVPKKETARDPVATHEDADAHDTDCSTVLPPFGLSTTDHELPSHAWTNGLLPESDGVAPTATHQDVDAQDTPFRISFAVPGFGLSTIDQSLPSQDSISVRFPSMMEYPTAMHEDVDTHDTERNTSSNVDAFGLSTTDHELPSHTSTNVSVPVSVEVEPTATHQEVDTHDTERN